MSVRATGQNLTKDRATQPQAGPPQITRPHEPPRAGLSQKTGPREPRARFSMRAMGWTLTNLAPLTPGITILLISGRWVRPCSAELTPALCSGVDSAGAQTRMDHMQIKHFPCPAVHSKDSRVHPGGQRLCLYQVRPRVVSGMSSGHSPAWPGRAVLPEPQQSPRHTPPHLTGGGTLLSTLG